MANLAIALKEEIRRLARKEVKAQVGSTRQSVARYRREIAALKRQLAEQSKQIAKLTSQTGVPAAPTSSDDGSIPDGTRFSSRSVRAQRARTGLSAERYGKLIGVTGLTIYNWEQGKSRPRKSQLAALVAVRGLGKREAEAKIAELEG